MLAAGIISQVESSRTSPILMETKKDGRPRFWIDFRNFNAVMKSNKWPVPSVEEIFDDLRGSSIFITLCCNFGSVASFVNHNFPSTCVAVHEKLCHVVHVARSP